jgi:serine/threonine protein kinase
VHGEVAALEALAGVEGVVPLLEYGLLMPQQQQQQQQRAAATTTTAAAAAGAPADAQAPSPTSVAPPSGPPRYCLVFPRYRCSLASWRAAHGRGLPPGDEGRRRAKTYLALFESVVGAVASIHSAGVVHFDLKCENVLCDPVPPEAAVGGGSAGGTPSAATRSSGGGGGPGAVAVGAASAAAWLRRSRTTPPSSAAARRRPPTASSTHLEPPHLAPPRKLVLADFGEAVVFGPAFTLQGAAAAAATAEGGDEGGGIGGLSTDDVPLLGPPHLHQPPTAAAAAAALALARRARGTELFSAPEVLLSGAGGASGDAAHPLHDRRRHRGAGSPADVWSLGCALYQLLTGTVLFEADGHAAVARVVGMAAVGGGAAAAPPAPPPILSPAEDALLAGHPALRDLVLFVLVRDPRRRPTAADLRRRVARVREEAYGAEGDDGGGGL